MSGKWFSNRGQLLQAVTAVASLAVSITTLALRWTGALPTGIIVRYLPYVTGGLFLLLLGVIIGRRSIGHSERQLVSTPTAANIPLPSRSATPAALEEKEQKPRLSFLGTEYIAMNEGVASHGLYRSAYKTGDGMGLIASFRNDDLNLTANSIRAHARYRDDENNEIGTGVSGLVWLDKGTERINLRPDESASVVILLDSKVKTFIVPWLERLAHRRNRSVAFGRTFVLDSLPGTIEIRIRDGDDDLLLDSPVVLKINRMDNTILTEELRG